MTWLLVAGLLLGGSEVIELHRASVDHRGGTVDAIYRGTIEVERRQAGTAGAPGRANTLRCDWTARISVRREALHPAGHMLARDIAVDEAPLRGRYAGWCEGAGRAIKGEVARRADRLRAHMIDAAARDRETLAAELNDANGDIGD
ncbi:hypothetical protein [uncultured Sphingomonas sp.]|uniref:hypothetical protein n=1 Tax=uncultured Sphingomonas sp. TaxID=158754 RepID=UPI002632FEF9|nr:hypothetical protein [uncultured Sphingomonas sp.]